MNIRELFDSKRLVLSFEVFPPKNTSPVKTIYKALNELSTLKPDFISVTYGAGGSLINNKTSEISSLIKNVYNIEALAHLTCISSKKENIDDITERLELEGITNILALRGDNNENEVGDYKYATDLIKYVNEKKKFNIISACYPEGHIENKGIEVEIMNMKRKIESGTSSFISQLFFDNNIYYDFLDKARESGVNVPIQAGIMPVVNKKQIDRITSLCGATIPLKFKKIMEKYEHDSEALREAGIAYAIEQIIDLASSGVEGIHLYTMNNPYVARRIKENIEVIIKSINNKGETIA
ncbi:methylenetetrahydrofolate reductase [NAD(P)H] [Clostridium baratii]|uniref:methylenetetrahydrofolate reductase [NAD(P)H] n=1 Tax=Clostridium baratii TaxID=1561 RepID=UPI0009A28141|nr:methylenetetrahydrofolate reductase [NAD(P)H] [Clostridium baratii]OPF52563.1 methylenetetrahydrofolate reductase [NAD(P)H] [Clostridium baratii]OPF56012.1 methylenetetrahydrofolate reductase [NAD(P)H] [Clostridium baratii]OPF58394.1 methylenetetrahydrofolate reductase [NAD(P)H] [Clostridium baratii]OPF59606.1 methylenetetrahydrofolate reductase [NAD(P)H] [Clostridium baratii]